MLDVSAKDRINRAKYCVRLITPPVWLGVALHLRANLTAQGTVAVERFLRGAPVLAPFLFANVGLLGLLVLFDPTEPVTESGTSL